MQKCSIYDVPVFGKVQSEYEAYLTWPYSTLGEGYVMTAGPPVRPPPNIAAWVGTP